MTEALDKKRVQDAMREAAKGGHDILREFDKVWAGINRGEYDVEPEVVVHARAVLNHQDEHDQATVFACEYIVRRHEGYPSPYVGPMVLDVQAQMPSEDDLEFDIQAAGRQLAAELVAEVQREDAIQSPFLVRDWILVVDYVQPDGDTPGWINDNGVTYGGNAQGSMATALGMLSVARNRILAVDAAEEVGE